MSDTETQAETPVSIAPRSARLGRVALTVGILLFVASIGTSILLGVVGGPFADRSPGGGFHFDFRLSDPDPTVRALASAMFAHVALGTGFGIWTFVQGIIAVATRRGRAPGVAAIVLAVITPILSIVVLLIAMSFTLPQG